MRRGEEGGLVCEADPRGLDGGGVQPGREAWGGGWGGGGECVGGEVSGGDGGEGGGA